MTKAYDRKLEASLKSSENFFDFYSTSGEVNPADMFVRKTTVKEARPYIATHHYSHLMPDSTKEVYIGSYDRVLAGICVFGMGTGKHQYTRLIPTLQDGEYRELTRLWSPDTMPKNTESKLISTSLRMLPSEVKIVLSYADPYQGHQGTIYQASNWFYIGQTKAGKKIVNHRNEEVHPRLISMYRKKRAEYTRMKTADIIADLGWRELQGNFKHRYCFLRGNKKQKTELKKYIQEFIKDYPK